MSSNYSGIPIEKIIIIRMSTLILMSSWLLSSMQLSLIISSEITARFSLKIPNKQINTLEELVNSDKSLIVYHTFMVVHNIKDHDVFNRMKRKIEQEQTLIGIDELYRNKTWIFRTSVGKAAMFFSTVPLKMLSIIHSKHLRPNTKFYFLDEKFTKRFLLTIASSTRLPKEFRIELNRR